jgi:hypothetical protein
MLRGKTYGWMCLITEPGHFLRHYLECKDKAPARTSAIIILPRWTNKLWWKLTQGLRTLRTYPVRTHLLTAPSTQPSGQPSGPQGDSADTDHQCSLMPFSTMPGSGATMYA